MDARAFLVVGPESTGTRLVTSILIAGGCEGDSGHEQEFDKKLPKAGTSGDIVWRRSIPHYFQWPSIPVLLDQLYKAGYGVQVVVTMREMSVTARSQVAAGHVANLRQAETNYIKALKHIFGGLSIVVADPQITVVSYDMLTTYPEQTVPWLLRRLKLNQVDDGFIASIYDGNAKYMGGKV